MLKQRTTLPGMGVTMADDPRPAPALPNLVAGSVNRYEWAAESYTYVRRGTQNVMELLAWQERGVREHVDLRSAILLLRRHDRRFIRDAVLQA